MLVEVKVPVLAESVPDATLLEWYKKPGERVERGENLIDLETDKVTLEVAAPEAGVLVEVRKRTGEVVLSDDVLAVIDTAATATATPATAAAPAAAPRADTAKMGPAARKLVAESAVDPAAIQGTGKDGRITKGDVLAATAAPAPVPAPKSGPSAAPVPAAPVGARSEERVPMTRVRKRTAERLLQAQAQAALLTTFNEVNMQPVMDLRSRYKDDFEKRHGVRLGFMSF
ncbi:MAG: E3 binding domain-containing protein, partial [Gammaproteobacteria bacterium]|nr:E3 binding domain-containing protein [Gammaproteobacteria bacterium]